ncbi:MAG: beta-ribofuranosylaminobenzene 5'-phosphate synthase family protein [Halobacteriota archaeon]
MDVQVSTSARLHFGFVNLSLSNERLYGSVGVALEEPRTVVHASRADTPTVEDPALHSLVEGVCSVLDVPGARVRIETEYPQHVGLGSGTQRALAVLAAVARAYGNEPRIRTHAPMLGRGGRSGVGVATFESGGFVLDDGHPTGQFTTEPPATGDWTVPRVAARHDIPEDWRFLIVVPAGSRGPHGRDEDRSMRATVERADPTLSDRIAGLVVRRILPAVTAGDVSAFGDGVAELGRLNGRWYAEEQGGVYRPPVGDLVTHLSRDPAIEGAGQSSWGPAVYGVTDAANAAAARRAGRTALAAAGLEGDVIVTGGRNVGASVEW